MKIFKISFATLSLAAALCAQAATVTLTGTLSNYGANSSDPAQFAGLTGIAVGDAYSLKLVFNDAQLVAPGSGAATVNLPNALQLFELSVNGILRVTATDIDLRLFNDVSNRDSFYIDDTRPLTVNGMTPGVLTGSISIQIHDASQTAVQYGQPVDIAKFFDNAADAFSLYAGINTNNPYSGNFTQLTFIATGDPVLVPPQTQSVPDTGASAVLLISGLLVLGAFKRVHR